MRKRGGAMVVGTGWWVELRRGSVERNRGGSEKGRGGADEYWRDYGNAGGLRKRGWAVMGGSGWVEGIGVGRWAELRRGFGGRDRAALRGHGGGRAASVGWQL